MSVRATGHPSRRHLAGRVALVLGLLGLVAGPGAPFAGAATGLTVTTPYPAVVVEPGGTASFKLDIAVDTARTVSLKANGVPDGWTARFRGGGLVVDGAYVQPKSATDLTFDVDIPDGAAAGTSTITIQATSGSLTDSLPVTIRVADAAAGTISLTSDFPQLSGTASSTFSFSLTLKNDTAAQQNYAIDATGPQGWTVSAKPVSSSQATSVTVNANSQGSITLTATPPSDVAAGTYPLKATVNGGGKSTSVDVSVVITGSYSMTVSTPDQVLSTSANAGTEKDFQITIDNTGTAPITNVSPSANAPTGWTVTFNPATVASIDPGKTETVTALITPSADAIAGDYNVTMMANAKEANANTTIRVRVETPQFWWIVGIVLIVAVFAGLYWVFRTYGRR